MENQSQALKPSRIHNNVIEGIDEHKIRTTATIKLFKLEKQMYMVVAPDPDIIIRTCG